MSERNDGGPAFPSEQSETQDGTWNQTHDYGMSLRDYFAAKAMQGWLSNSTATPVEAGVEDATPQDMASVAATFGYMVADAMLAEREK